MSNTRIVRTCVATAALVSFLTMASVVSAEAGSASRADTRLGTDETVETTVTTARSKSRRATRGGASAEQPAYAQTRGKRSRRSPAKDETGARMVAQSETQQTDLLALASGQAETFERHVAESDFDGVTGALALFQLAGKAQADTELSPAEVTALHKVLETSDWATLIKDTENRLIEAASTDIDLEDLAAALGVSRPIAGSKQPAALGA
ncbi:MAG: hypothetical protein AAF222_05200 [Pseudomonadota bacterium]